MSGPVLRVMVTAGRDSGKVVEVTGERAVIGRDPECDIVLDDGNVSRRHAAIERLPDGSVCLSDLGSTNGTFVDGRRVDGPLALSGDEQVCLGDTVLAVERPPPPAPPPPPDPPPGPPAWATLTVRSGPLHGTTLRVAGERFVIGRHDGADLVLDDPKVSGRHADLSIEATGRVTLTDLGSRNGTWVDGRRVVDAVAVSGNEDVRIGDTLLAIAPVDGAPMPGDTVLSAVVPMWLVVESGADEGRRVEITSERFLVGRGPASDLVLDAHDVSRQHAILTASPERGAVVADLGSRNGTFVNDRRIDAPQALRTGDRVRIASVGLRFEEPGGTIAGAPPSAARMIPGAPSGIRGLSPGLSVDRTPPPLSTEGLARWCSRRPWTTFALWATALVAAAALVVALFADSLTSEGTVAGNPESKRGDALLQERLRGPRRITETVIVSSSSAGLTVGDAAFRERVTSIYDDAIGLGRDVVVRGRHFYQRRDRSLVSRDRRTTVMPLEMAGDLDHAAEQVPKLVDVVDRADRDPDFRVLVYGEASVDADFEKLSEEDLKTGEVYGLAVALVVLVFVFRALVAALIPMALAIVSIGVALGLTTLVAQAFSLSFFVTNMIVGMGLALGIDYTLFVLTRYREERGGGRAAPDAIAAAGGTAGRAVLFSGMAVVLALVGMLFVPDTVLRSLGVGAILVGIVSVVAALTILPAVLGVLGDRVNGGALPGLRTQAQEPAGTSFWARVATIVMRRPVVSLVLSVVVLAVAAVPVLDLRTGSSGVSTLPDRLTSKQGFVVLDREFDAGRGSPAEIVIDGRVESPPVRRAIDRLRARVDRDRDFGEPSAPRVNRRGDLALVTAPLSGDVQSPRAFAAIRRLRSTYIPDAFGATRAQVLVTGTTAFAVDEDAATSNAAPFVFAFVLGLSFVLLTLAFRSIVVPLKAIVMNLLSVGAAYGLLVLVFQEGHGASFFGFEQVAAVESWVPLFLFSVLFGLSMDYHVFLLSRIRERFNQTGDNREAVATGITTTARLITGAALIMVAVFSGFAAGDLVMFQQMGFGLAVALLIDATIVRSVLVPATMTLLGKRNWYLPRWLRWLPEVGVEGQGR